MRECAAGHRVTRHRRAAGLPLLCVVVVCVMWPAEARPVDFVCDRGSRRRAVSSVAQMQTDLVRRSELTLSSELFFISVSPIVLKCTDCICSLVRLCWWMLKAFHYLSLPLSVSRVPVVVSVE